MSLNVTLTRAGSVLLIWCNTVLTPRERCYIMRNDGYGTANEDSDLLKALAPALLEETNATPLIVVTDTMSIVLGGTPIEKAEAVVVDTCRQYDPSARFFAIDGKDALVEMHAVAESPAS